MKNKKLQAILISVVVFGGLAVASNVLALGYALKDVPCAQVGTANSGGYEIAPNCGPCDLVRVGVNLTNMIMAVSGSIALVMFVLAGVMMIASYVNPKWVTQAKDTVKYTIIGLFLIFSSYTIVNLVISALYGGTGDMGVLQGGYEQATGKTSWGVCDSTNLGGGETKTVPATPVAPVK